MGAVRRNFWGHVVLDVGAVMAFALTGCRHAGDAAKEQTRNADIELAVLSGLEAAPQGLARAVSLMRGRAAEQARSATARELVSPSLGLLVSGNTFVDPESAPADADVPCARQRLEAVADILALTHPLVVGRGPLDMGLHRPAIEASAARVRLPLLARPVSEGTRVRIDTVLWQGDGLVIGVLGAPAPTAPELDAYVAAALALRAQGAELIIALVGEPAAVASAFVARLARIDVVVAGGSLAPTAPAVLGTALLLESASRGRALGLLGVHRRGAGGWVFAPAAAAPGSGGVPVVTPPGSYVDWRLVPLGDDVPAARSVSERLQRAAAACAATRR